MDEKAIKTEFVEFIPDELNEETLYISEKYGCAIHKCFCGCGKQVVTPFYPTGWKLIKDDKGVTLDPSIGSWNLPCRSHYWVKNSKVVWA
jgi:hypothetical protein